MYFYDCLKPEVVLAELYVVSNTFSFPRIFQGHVFIPQYQQCWATDSAVVIQRQFDLADLFGQTSALPRIFEYTGKARIFVLTGYIRYIVYLFYALY